MKITRRLVLIGTSIVLGFNVLGAADADKFNAPKTITSKSLGDGIAAYQYTYDDLYGGPQIISIIAVNLNNPEVEIGIGVCKDKTRMAVSKLAQQYDAAAAINFGFFNMADPSAAAGALKAAGIVEGTWAWDIGGFFYHKGNQVTISTTAPVYDDMDGVRATFPMLVSDGEIFNMGSTEHIPQRHPRTAIGVTEQNILYMVTVDGRMQGNAVGVSCYDLADFMQRLGCIGAVNLDGGGSTAMWTKKDGIINYPSDNKTFDHAGERRVYDIFYVRNK